MKKFILPAIGLFLTIGILASCSGKNAEKEREDSTRIADSIAAVEAAQAAQEAAIEQAHLDSLRQDSIKNDEIFAKAVKALEDLNSASDTDKYLKSLGFTGSKKTSKRTQYDEMVDGDIEITIEKYNYTLTAGNKTIKYQCDIEDTLSWGSSTEKVTIEGDEDALNNFFRWAKEHGDEVTKKGNTVVIQSFWA